MCLSVIYLHLKDTSPAPSRPPSHARVSPVELWISHHAKRRAPRMSWSNAHLECVRGQQGKERRLPSKSPGTLKVKAGEKLVSTTLAASTACQESRGYYFGERVLRPECSSRWLWSNVYSTWTSAGEMHGQTGAECFCFFCEENTLYEATEVSSLLRGTRRRNRPTSRPPIKSTGLEIGLT